jgi:hypothetical protein
MVEDSEYTIPTLVEVNPPDPNTRKRLSLKDGKRLPGKVRNIANPQVADTKDYWFLDHFVNRVKVPFGEKTEINFWHSLNKLKREDELYIYDAYSTDLQTRQKFTLEVKRWKARWELYPTDQVRPSHLCETLELVSKKWYPHLYCILKIYLTMSPSTATTERSFSVLKRVKTYLRATM